MKFHKSAEVFDQAKHWTYRVLLASLPTTTGAIVRAMLGKNSANGPAYGKHADIRRDGLVITLMRQPGQVPALAPVGHIQAVRDNLRRLADHCKLNDADREALFEELRKWIRRDHRATSTGE